jgi:electron transport complex protein RnfG
VLRKFIQQSWLAVVASLVFGALVAGVYGGLEGRIAHNQHVKMAREMQALLPEATDFQTVPDHAGQTLYTVGKDAAGQTVGYVCQASGGGFADVIVLVVATDAKIEKLRGVAVIKSNETPGFGDKIKEDPFRGQFAQSPAPSPQGKLLVVKEGSRAAQDREIVAVTGATISSEATTKIVNDAVIRLRQMVAEKGPSDAGRSSQ